MTAETMNAEVAAGRQPRTRRDPLLDATAAPGQGAAFRAELLADLIILTPLTARADLWLRLRVGADAAWAADSLVIESSAFAELADAIIAAGFLFQRRALPI